MHPSHFGQQRFAIYIGTKCHRLPSLAKG